MLTFLSENIGTIVVLLVLVAIISSVIVKMIKDKKNGKTSCGCGCENCPSSGVCHKK